MNNIMIYQAVGC